MTISTMTMRPIQPPEITPRSANMIRITIANTIQPRVDRAISFLLNDRKKFQ